MSDARAPGRLRVAVLNRVFSAGGGGAESYSIRLVEQLAARHEIHVFAQEIRHDWPGVTYHRVSSPLRKPRWVNQIWYAVATWSATRRASTSCTRTRTPGAAGCRPSTSSRCATTCWPA